MTQQGHIVDFNEARAASSVRRARSYADDWAQSMATADRRRTRSAARAFSASDDSPRTARAHRSWSDLGTSTAPTARQPRSVATFDLASSRGSRSDRYSSQSTSGLGSTSASPSRGRDAVPGWLADAYADLEDAKAQSSSAIGAAAVSPSRNVGRSTRYDAPASAASDSFAFAPASFDLDFEEQRRRPTPRPAQRSRRAASSPTTRDDDFGTAPRSAVFDEESLREEDEAPTAKKKGLFSKIKGAKKQATKNKADRQFDRQFGGEPHANVDEPGPRAALYKGEMGQQQRYAQRLQQSASPSYDGGFSFGSNRGESYQAASQGVEHAPRAARGGHPILKVGVAVFALVICGCAFMFPTVQSYYQTMREHDRLEAEYQAVEERNEALQSSINDLSSDDGVAAYAHDQYGWIMPGEQTATVQGLELSPTSGLDNITTSVQSGSIKAPETWYSPVLDKVFGVE